MKTCRAEPKNKRPADFCYRLNCTRGWVSSIVIMASSEMDESHRSRFLLVCFSCLFINGSAFSLSLSLFLLSLLSLLSVGLCPSRCSFGCSLVFVAALHGRARRHAYSMLFGLELSRFGIGRRGEEPCVFLRIWIIYTAPHEVVDNRTQWGETRVCLFVCLFVCCVCKPSGKTRAAGRKEWS